MKRTAEMREKAELFRALFADSFRYRGGGRLPTEERTTSHYNGSGPHSHEITVPRTRAFAMAMRTLGIQCCDACGSMEERRSSDRQDDEPICDSCLRDMYFFIEGKLEDNDRETQREAERLAQAEKLIQQEKEKKESKLSAFILKNLHKRRKKRKKKSPPPPVTSAADTPR